MYCHKRKPITQLILSAWTVLLLAAAMPALSIGAQGRAAGETTACPAYLELSVAPPLAAVGDLVTLKIVYHNLFKPYTQIYFEPDGLVTFDPLLTLPCKWEESPNHCTAITFRALEAGQVTIHAGATGEIYDPECRLLWWAGGSDNGPAVLTIVDHLWKFFFPLVQW